MNNDLDKLFQDQLAGLESNPPGVEADVEARWARVQGQLEEKRRRRFVWWIPAAAAAALLVLGLRWLLPAPKAEEVRQHMLATLDTLPNQLPLPENIVDTPLPHLLAPKKLVAQLKPLDTIILLQQNPSPNLTYAEADSTLQLNVVGKIGNKIEEQSTIIFQTEFAQLIPGRLGPPYGLDSKTLLGSGTLGAQMASSPQKLSEVPISMEVITTYAGKETGRFSRWTALSGKSKKKVALSPHFTKKEEEVLVFTSHRNEKKVERDSTRLNEFSSNVEEYAPLIENEYRAVSQEPLSTFSIDVDAASYTNIRRHIMDESRLPHKDAVRIEEMVNYFDYDYQTPTSDMPFAVNTELSECPWNPRHQLLLIGMQGKRVGVQNLPSSNLVFLLDVSGSMTDPNKLPLVKDAITRLVENLRERDRVSMVVYAGAAGLVLPPTPGNRKVEILEALNQLEAGGSTAGGEGIELAYKVARENFMPDGNNRVILCTDGDFNVGINSESGLEELIARKREEGVFLSVLGFGTGNLKDSKMELLADKGNGNYAYIDSEEEGRRVFGKEFGATLFTIAKDVKLQVEFNPALVKGYRLIGYENRALRNEDFANDKIDAGELGAGHRVTALYEIIPAGSSEQIPGTEPLRYEKKSAARDTAATAKSNELLFLKLRYKEPKGTESKLVNIPVEYAPVKGNESSSNFRWASAVAAFGLILRESKFSNHADYDLVLELARSAQGTDPLRAEFVEMVEKAKGVSLEAKGR